MKLKDKAAIVTGAASGIGKAIALLYAQEGAKVAVADLNLEGAQKVAEEIKAQGRAAFAIKTNVVLEEDIQALVDTTVSTFGTVDILVNNAGIMDNFEPAGDIEDQMWERVFAVNITSIMRSTRKVLPIFLEKQKGAILNIASVGGLEGARAGAAYTASKHAVIGFSKNTGFMYAPQGIRCNVIAPGAVATNIGSTITKPHPLGMERQGLGMPLNPRAGDPEEIAQVALFLASDDSSFINGAVVVADGGWSSY